MEFQDKALYNLLRMNWLEDPKIDVEPWQVEDYRSLSEAELFSGLEKLKIHLDRKKFLLFAENVDAPEELVDYVLIEEKEKKAHDLAYLLVFELWRRLLPNKQSLSIFCDELDHRFYLYDKDPLLHDELIQKTLQELEDILDQNVDQGGHPKEVFTALASYCAHDLESFIYDYIAEQIDKKNELYASELLDGFYEYIPNPAWFDFLRARLFALTDAYESSLILQRILEQLQEEPDLDLTLEIAAFLVHAGEPVLFIKAAKQAFPLVRKEEQFQELIHLVSEFFFCLDQEKQQHVLQNFLDKRKEKHPEALLDPKDADRSAFERFLEDVERGKV